ncbi:DUF927 domain-containing protein [Salmonella enterica]|uniref:DUF927 domain-containing protein n=1 Tax=Salmonella enterica TaxID=28901 RepID=UPI001288DCCD|nr:DUF927 domain-containing protein [Salmonella enterica subsp. diarizonae]ECI5274428.1 DUF927 domain-containing protein [Salmonella enterica subsp. diarizonae]MCB2240826.1 DUF927 domain-containing protein [Salmonella enterica subsp. diarizonae]
MKKQVTETMKLALNRWPFVLQTLGIAIPSNGRHGACPACGGKDRFRFDDKDGRGTWFCNHCGSGDGLDLVSRVMKLDVKAAAESVASTVGNISTAGAAQVKAPARKEVSDAQKRAQMVKTYAALVSNTTIGESAYLKNKGLPGHQYPLLNQPFTAGGMTFPDASLLLPLTAIDGSVSGAQLISPDGNKCLLAGSKMGGAFLAVSPVPDEYPERVIITEGFATAITVSGLADGWCVAAVSANNLLNVARVLRDKWPDTRLVIAGDNDFADGKDNPGREKAYQAAQAVNGWVTVPPGQFKADWDDFRREFGVLRARDAFSDEMVNPNDTETRLPHGFRLTKDFLWFDKPAGDDGDSSQTRQIKICSPLRVTAITCDADGGKFGRLLEWEDSNGIKHEWAMPMTVLAGSGQELREVLLDNGLHFISVNGAARGYLMEYISTCRPVRKVTCVNKTGWHGSVYVLQDEVIGTGAGSVILQSAYSSKNDFRASGTTTEWIEQIGRYCVGNSRLAFCVSLSLAAPLLHLIGAAAGGYHLKGESTDGKTTTMKVAASVCGSPEYWKTWRATGNALEGIALRRNDAALMLDEISEVDGKEASRIAYMLGNGQGKSRSRVDGSLRDPVTWSVLYMSTGEVSIMEHAAESGEKRTGAGVGVRMVQIPSDTGRYGAFEELHGFAGGKEFAEHLEQASKQYYGAVFRDWVRYLTGNLLEVTNRARAMKKEFEKSLLPENAGNQVGRIVDRFALLAVAGELASEVGITGWGKGEGYRAAESCLASWLADRGHSSNQEERDALERVRQFVTANQFTRFADWNDEKSRPASMVGYRRTIRGNDSTRTEPETTFYMLSSGWKEMCGNYDPVKVARLCRAAGWLIVDPDSTRNQTAVRLPEIGLKKVFVLSSEVIG